jgi:succinate dehydrogenase / fumarate reductase, membrane anchor subunit
MSNAYTKNKESVGTQRIVVGSGYGMRDWLMQRITAVVMVVFFLIVLISALISPDSGFKWWSGLMAYPVMQVLAMVTFIALAWHAWVGMRDIWMDYVKHAGLRLTLHIVTIAWVLACLLYAMRVLWRL